MAKLAILEFPDPRLRKKATPVSDVDDELRTLIDNMFETMYAAPGIGLAATQVGLPLRPMRLPVLLSCATFATIGWQITSERPAEGLTDREFLARLSLLYRPPHVSEVRERLQECRQAGDARQPSRNLVAGHISAGGRGAIVQFSVALGQQSRSTFAKRIGSWIFVARAAI